MTVITYRDGTMAADRNCTTDQDLTIGLRLKVLKVRGWLVGGTGRSDDCMAFAQWAAMEFHPADKPTLRDKFSGIAVAPDGRVDRYDDGLVCVTLDAPYHAIGSGAAVALGAFHAGADALTAVAAACVHCPFCGGGIDAIRLDTLEAAPLPPAAASTVGS